MQGTHSFGEWLRRRRRALDLTQKALAEATSCSEDAIRKIESDERRPSRRLAERLANRLGVPEPDQALFLEAARALRGVDSLPAIPRAAVDSDAGVGPRDAPMGPADQERPMHAQVASGATTFVGRKREMNLLADALGSVMGGAGQLAMLAGEPGIGKTRTANELARRALAQQCQVLWGRCYEGSGAPPFWPWVQAIRSYVEQCNVAQLQTALASGASEIAEIVPEVRERLGQLPVLPALDPEQARFRLFDSVARFLRNAGRGRALVLILEDLHWADQASLRLLEFLSGELTSMHVFLIGTYRDVEVSRRHPLSRTLAELTRHGLSGRIALPGLTREDVAEFVASMVGSSRATPDLVEAVHGQTEGNPLFVTETMRLLTQEGSLIAAQGGATTRTRIPEGIREVIGRRLDRLSMPCNDCLTSAAVIGRQFTLEQLTRLMENMSTAQVLGAIEEALESRIIEELPEVVDEYQFTHALIGETLVAELSTTKRVRVHARIGAMLEELYGNRSSEHAPELAYHFAESASVTGNDKLIRYSMLAGEQAFAAHAHEQAAAHYERALAAKEGTSMDAQLAEILFGRGRAAMMGLERHRFVELIDSLQRAFDYFVSVGEIGKAVEIADSSFPHFMGVEGTMTSIIDRALALVPPDSIEAGRLLTRKGRILGVSVGDDDGARAALTRALAIALRERDAVVERRTYVSGAYVAFFNLRQTDAVELGVRAIDLAESALANDDAVAARYFVVSCLRHLGRVEEMNVHADALQASARRLRNRFWIAGADWLSETAARMRGDWNLARSFSDHGLELSPNDIRLLSTRVFLEYEVGEIAAGNSFLARLEEAVRMTPPGATPEYGMACAVMAQTVELTDQRDRLAVAEEFARAVLSAPSPAAGLRVPARIALGLSGLHRRSTDPLREFWDDLQGSRHPLFLPGTHSYDRLLARFAHALELLDDAAKYFQEAITLCRRINYESELAWSLFNYAAFFKDRDARGDRAARDKSLIESRQIAERLGMKLLMDHIARFSDAVR